MISGEPLPKAWELAGCPPQQGRPESPLAAVGEGRGTWEGRNRLPFRKAPCAVGEGAGSLVDWPEEVGGLPCEEHSDLQE